MPTNLPPEARAKWAKYLEARTPEEKLTALQEYLSAIPKHKGTENLRAWVRKKIAELREEIEEKKARRAGTGGPSFFIEKEGAAQAIMLGLPNSGKSSLLKKLTNAKPKISNIPYTTKFPVPGMLTYEDIQIQLVEAPSIIERISQGSIWWGSRVLGLARNADALVIVLDSSQNPIKQAKIIRYELGQAGIYLTKPKGLVKINKSKAIHGIKITLSGKITDATIKELKELLKSYKITNVEVKIFGEVTLEEIEKALFEKITYKPSVALLNKVDLLTEEEIKEGITGLNQLLPNVKVIPVSAVSGYGLGQVSRSLFNALGIIRVYTKEPNSSLPSKKPLILKEGATVADAIKKIREEYLRFFKYARIWGPSAKYAGERVGLDHVLKDKDIIEIRTKIKGI